MKNTIYLQKIQERLKYRGLSLYYALVSFLWKGNWIISF